ncbi:DUF6318 family protein [Demequina sp. NBRC 110056]|uniref:DUF6318 family protein n=1 Tax=Demequina sp. NBRC 110056 TaxID=1570345 RepID=UPI000A0777A5|nr:DUF6318 family protein [Demequina sp. NBRC 110056]
MVTPTPSPTETPSPTPTPSPTATTLTEDEVLAALPPEALVESFPGAVAFAEFFVGLFPELFQESAQPELFAALSGPDCVFCANALENAATAQERGLTTTGGGIALDSASAQGGLREEPLWQVEAPFTEAAIDYLDAEGQVVDEDGERSGNLVAVLSYEDERWSMADVAFEYRDAD